MKPIIKVKKDGVYLNGQKIKLGGFGGVRLKYMDQDIIIKFDREAWDGIPNRCQSTKEINIWFSRIKKEDRKYFAKPIAYSRKHGYIAQKRIRFKKGRPTNKAREIIRDISKKYRIKDVECGGAFGKWNWGMRANGTPVIFDWGV